MVRIIYFNRINWLALYKNMRKVQWSWGTVSGVLAKAGAIVRSI